MLPQAKGSSTILIYAADEAVGAVDVYDYGSGTQVGSIGILATGGCVDAAGDVYFSDSGDGTLVEYAHGGTKPLKRYHPGGELGGCSIDADGDIAVTGGSPGRVIIYPKGDAKKGTTYSDGYCDFDAEAMGYDGKGDVVGEGMYDDISVCGVLAGAKQETTLATKGITIGFPNGVMWDGKHLAVGDQEAGSGKNDTGLYEATVSGTTVVARKEVLLTDSCYRGLTDVLDPFVLGKKNTPVNTQQGRVVVGSNAYCFSGSGGGGIEYWHYPAGGNPYKMYTTADPITVLTVSIGT
jgi:hypothetical protein